MKTLDIEIAVMRYFGTLTNLIVPNISGGMSVGLHECDLLVLSKDNYATEVEIKVSKADIRADKKKEHGHKHDHIARLFFAVPIDLKDYTLKHIPKGAGLLTIKEHDRKYNAFLADWDYMTTCKARQGRRNKNCHEWTQEERANLARLGTLRILGLKEKIQKLIKGFECG